MITLNKHADTILLPCVVDYIPYEHHAVIDVIMLKDDIYKKGQELDYNGKLVVEKKLKFYPVQTELEIQNKKEVVKVRYFCNKVNV